MKVLSKVVQSYEYSSISVIRAESAAAVHEIPMQHTNILQLVSLEQKESVSRIERN